MYQTQEAQEVDPNKEDFGASLARLDSLLGEACRMLPMTPQHSKRRSASGADCRPSVPVPKINICSGEDRKLLQMAIQTPHSKAIGSLIDEADLLLGDVEEHSSIPSRSNISDSELPYLHRASTVSAITSLIAEGEECLGQLTPKHRHGGPMHNQLVVDQLLRDVAIPEDDVLTS